MLEGSGVSERCHRAVALARKEARSFSRRHVDTEHLLLGLLREGSIAAGFLAEFDVTFDKVREQVKGMFEGGDQGAGEVEFAFTRRSRSVVERARQEAKRLGHNYMATEHLLLGLLGGSEGGAARALSNLGVDRDRVHQAIVRSCDVDR